LDKNDGVMRQKPRDPNSPLLDRVSLYFIIFTGIIKALAGGALLVVLPLFGYGAAVIRTAVFLFESIAQLFFAYPARHLTVIPRFNPRFIWRSVSESRCKF
jgi:P-type Ca2+ transporter type 2C